MLALLPLLALPALLALLSLDKSMSHERKTPRQFKLGRLVLLPGSQRAGSNHDGRLLARSINR